MFVITPEQATAIATAMGRDLRFSLKRGRVYLTFQTYGKKPDLLTLRWDAYGGSHFPSWSHSAPWGGTWSSVLDMLAKAIQGKPVWPLRTWDYLVNPPCLLGGGHRAAAILEAVRATSWPESVPCLLCGKQINRVGDWWTIGAKKNRVSGPGCSMSDCREVPA